MQRLLRFFLPLLAASALIAAPAQAQLRNSDNITFIVPYAAGGTADTLARQLAEVIRRDTGAVLVIENQGGAGGAIGAANVARASSDSRRVMLASTSALTISPNLREVKYDPIADFTPIISAAIGPVAILASSSAPFQDFQGMLDYAKKHPQALRYGTPGVGSVAHLAIEGLQMQADISLTHVPYRGESPAIQDALGGVVELLVVNTPTTLQHVQAGNLRPLAVLEPKRLEPWPDVPTLTEAGFPNLEYSSNFGIFVHSTMPAETLKAIAAMFEQAVSSPQFQETLSNLSLLPGSAKGEQFGKQIAEELQRNAEIIKARKIKVE